MIVIAVIGGVIVVGLAWAGWHDFRRRRRSGRLTVAEGFIRAKGDRQAKDQRHLKRRVTVGGLPRWLGVQARWPHFGRTRTLNAAACRA
jgi:hypothetical protein